MASPVTPYQVHERTVHPMERAHERSRRARALARTAAEGGGLDTLATVGMATSSGKKDVRRAYASRRDPGRWDRVAYAATKDPDARLVVRPRSRAQRGWDRARNGAGLAALGVGGSVGYALKFGGARRVNTGRFPLPVYVPKSRAWQVPAAVLGATGMAIGASRRPSPVSVRYEQRSAMKKSQSTPLRTLAKAMTPQERAVAQRRAAQARQKNAQDKFRRQAVGTAIGGAAGYGAGRGYFAYKVGGAGAKDLDRANRADPERFRPQETFTSAGQESRVKRMRDLHNHERTPAPERAAAANRLGAMGFGTHKPEPVFPTVTRRQGYRYARDSIQADPKHAWKWRAGKRNVGRIGVNAGLLTGLVGGTAYHAARRSSQKRQQRAQRIGKAEQRPRARTDGASPQVGNRHHVATGLGASAATLGFAGGGVPRSRASKLTVDVTSARMRSKPGTYYRAKRAGIFGYRQNAHHTLLEFNARMNPRNAEGKGKRRAYNAGRIRGARSAEKKIVRHMRAGKIGSNALLIGGLGSLGYGLSPHAARGAHTARDWMTKAAAADDRKNTMMMAGGGGLGVGALGFGQVLDREGQKWLRQADRGYHRAEKLVPGLGGATVRTTRGGKYKSVRAKVKNRDVRASHFRGVDRATARRAGRLRGRATQASYFGNVYNINRSVLRGGVAPLALGTAAYGAHRYRRDHSPQTPVRKADWKNITQRQVEARNGRRARRHGFYAANAAMPVAGTLAMQYGFNQHMDALKYNRVMDHMLGVPAQTNPVKRHARAVRTAWRGAPPKGKALMAAMGAAGGVVAGGAGYSAYGAGKHRYSERKIKQLRREHAAMRARFADERRRAHAASTPVRKGFVRNLKMAAGGAHRMVDEVQGTARSAGSAKPSAPTGSAPAAPASRTRRIPRKQLALMAGVGVAVGGTTAVQQRRASQPARGTVMP